MTQDPSGQNPLEALGAALGGGPGGLDLGGLLQQAQQMQDELQAAQERLAESTVDGSVAGGAVTVTVSGTGELTAVTIAPVTVDGEDAESLAELGDLDVAAFRDARSKADELAKETLGPVAGGLPGLPGLPGEGGADGPAGPLGFR